MSTITHSAHMDIFQNLAVDLDTEGRYLFLNAIANQLRYPNSHTHYFSCTMLYLFAEANTEAIQEQITRVLLEWLIVNRPHPWGLLITFIELIKNPAFKFWNHEFVHCAPEIEKWVKSNSFHCFSLKTGEIIIWRLQLAWVIKKGVVAKISKTQGLVRPEFFSPACTCLHSSGYSSPSHSAAWDKSRLSK